MEKMVALMMIAYALGVLVGEAIRDHIYPEPGATQDGEVSKVKGKARQLYSGLFILLKQRLDLTTDTLRGLVSQVLHSFTKLVWGDVPTLV